MKYIYTGDIYDNYVDFDEHKKKLRSGLYIIGLCLLESYLNSEEYYRGLVFGVINAVSLKIVDKDIQELGIDTIKYEWDDLLSSKMCFMLKTDVFQSYLYSYLNKVEDISIRLQASTTLKRIHEITPFKFDSKFTYIITNTSKYTVWDYDMMQLFGYYKYRGDWDLVRGFPNDFIIMNGVEYIYLAYWEMDYDYKVMLKDRILVLTMTTINFIRMDLLLRLDKVVVRLKVPSYNDPCLKGVLDKLLEMENLRTQIWLYIDGDTKTKGLFEMHESVLNANLVTLLKERKTVLNV